MPKKPKSPCRWPHCLALSEEMYCEKHKKLAEKQYNKYKRDPNTYKQYGSWG